VPAVPDSAHSAQSSGLGSASCSQTKTGNNGNYIKITCTTSTLTQYVSTAHFLQFVS
jgi:rhamnogalacturonan endolyase